VSLDAEEAQPPPGRRSGRSPLTVTALTVTALTVTALTVTALTLAAAE
jgi:hypothetical protein